MTVGELRNILFDLDSKEKMIGELRSCTNSNSNEKNIRELEKEIEELSNIEIKEGV